MALPHRLRGLGNRSRLRATARGEDPSSDLGDDQLEQSLVWILGSPRSGSTWLLNLLRAHPGVVKMDEPGIGLHLGPFASDVIDAPAAAFDPERLLFRSQRSDSPDYFFSSAHEHVWRPLLRDLILARVRSHLEARTPGPPGSELRVAIKEPHGSQAADLLLSVLPRARLIFLLRDGRDVVASELDASEAGSWAASRFGGGRSLASDERLGFAQQRAHKWLARTEAVERAYRALPDPQRLLVRYEELRADTAPVVAGVLAGLGLDVSADAVAATVAALSLDAVPDERKGPGMFVRSATPGSWREHLTEAEQATVHAVIGDKLAELGYR